MGVTGTREHVADTAEILVRRTRDLTQESRLPICVGLGISNAEQAAEVAAYADGVIVGAGFCQRVLDAPDLDTARTAVRSFAQELAAGVRARCPAPAVGRPLPERPTVLPYGSKEGPGR